MKRTLMLLIVLVSCVFVDAQITLPNYFGVRLSPFPSASLGHPVTTVRTMDATGESVLGIGQILLSTGPGTSKAISSAGGKLYWRLESATFADAGTNLRIGVQDLSSGLEDGTFDVYADLVGGTDTLTAGVMATAMETGSKTIAHGDFVAIGIEMTARGGADTVGIRSVTSSTDSLNSYLSVDTGSGPTRATGLPLFTLSFNDGTIGWIVASPPVFVETATAVNTGTTPDEYALCFQIAAQTQIGGMVAVLDNIATTDTYDFVLYSNPLVTPVAERTVTMDPNLIAGATIDATATALFATAYTLQANTTYAVAFLPTSANSISLSRIQFGTGNAALRAVTTLGVNWYECTRSDVTGAFTENTEVLPLIAPILNGFGTAGRRRIIGGD